jgi:hypothetical protein
MGSYGRGPQTDKTPAAKSLYRSVAGAAQEILFLNYYADKYIREIRLFLCVQFSSFLATVVLRYNKSTALNW